ncbi:MAG: hypothetical protein ABI905_13250 [Betaproteobacteria bacterium]
MISDNELLLHHYGDGLDEAEREKITRELAAQPDLAMRQRTLVAGLDAAACAPNVLVPAEMHRRWRASLEQAARSEKSAASRDTHRASLFGSFQWRTGAATFGVVLLATSIGLGIYSNRDVVPGDVSHPAGVPVRTVGLDDASRYERGLQWHLASTERQLANLGSADGDERTRLVDRVIAQNRLYTIAADRANEPRLARVLRSFTPILENLADNHTEKREFDAGLSQLNFELKVMQARLATATSTAPTAQLLAL